MVEERPEFLKLFYFRPLFKVFCARMIPEGAFLAFFKSSKVVYISFFELGFPEGGEDGDFYGLKDLTLFFWEGKARGIKMGEGRG